MARRSKGKRTAIQRQERRAKYAGARRDLGKLKAKGLISPKANLRKDKPSSGLLKKLEILRPVLTDQAAAVRLPSKQRRDFKDAGFFTTRGFTVVPKAQGERVIVDKKRGLPELKAAPRPDGTISGAPFVRRVLLPANVRDYAGFEKFLREHPNGYNGYGGDGYYYSLTFYGNKSSMIRRWDQLYEFLIKYKVFEDQERFEALILYELNYEGQKQWAIAYNVERNERAAKRRGHFQPNMPLDAQGKANRRAREAARMRRYRAKQKERIKV